MGKMEDLLVRLKLDHKDYDKGLKKAKSGSGGFLSSLMNIKAGAAAVWAAVGAGAVKLADKFAHTSQTFGDKWDQAMSGMKGAWSTFTESLTSWNWDNFFGRMKKAAKNAASNTEAQDAMTELLGAANLRNALQGEELAQLRIDMDDTSKSYSERYAATQQYLSMVAKYYKDIEKAQKQLMNSRIDQFLGSAGLAATKANRNAAIDFFSNIDSFGDLDKLSHRNSIYGSMAKAYQSNSSYEDLFKIIKDWADANSAYLSETRRIVTKGKGLLQQDKEEKEKAAKEAEIELPDLSIDPYDLSQEIADLEQEWIDEIPDLKIDATIPKETLESVQKLSDEFKEAKERAEELSNTIASGVNSAIDELMDQIFGVEDFNMGSVLQALLTPLAELAEKEGAIVFATGIGIDAVKDSLKSLNGGAAIAAGLSLMAVGAAAKAGLQALSNSTGSSASSTSSSSYSGGTSTTSQNISSELTVYVKGKISGKDILLSSERTKAALSR